MARFFGRRRDENHFPLIEAFRQLGCSVIDVSQTPCGFDILVGYGGLTMPVELKRDAKAKLTEFEQKIHDSWTGGKRVVWDMDGVAETVNVLRRWHAWVSQAALKAGYDFAKQQLGNS